MIGIALTNIYTSNERDPYPHVEYHFNKIGFVCWTMNIITVEILHIRCILLLSTVAKSQCTTNPTTKDEILLEWTKN
jgi:hypothetical protein